MKKFYAIPTHQNWKRVKAVLEELFALGFVFDEYRFKTWKEVSAIYWLSTLDSYSHIMVNSHADCKSTLHPRSYWVEDMPENVIQIEMEEFVKGIKEGTICL